ANLPISLLRSVFLSLCASYILVYLLPDRLTAITPKTNLLLCAMAAIVLLYTWRRCFYSFFSNQKRNLAVLLIGSETTVELVQQQLNKKPHLGYRLVDAMNEIQAIQSKLQNPVDLIAI